MSDRRWVTTIAAALLLVLTAACTPAGAMPPDPRLARLFDDRQAIHVFIWRDSVRQNAGWQLNSGR